MKNTFLQRKSAATATASASSAHRAQPVQQVMGLGPSSAPNGKVRKVSPKGLVGKASPGKSVKTGGGNLTTKGFKGNVTPGKGDDQVDRRYILKSEPYFKGGKFVGVRFRLSGDSNRVLVFDHDDILANLEKRGIRNIRTTVVLWTNTDRSPIIEHSVILEKGNIKKISVYSAFAVERRVTYAEKKALRKTFVTEKLLEEAEEAKKENMLLKDALKSVMLKLDMFTQRNSGVITTGVELMKIDEVLPVVTHQVVESVESVPVEIPVDHGKVNEVVVVSATE